ncbi:MAG TPA: hypothetical protein VNQ78_19920 [Paracoccus sp. (in: a-proteobacteria)]|uniref:hypothetical protein n=1 Tax=Paracoccus sp. TaxID=267 RepID=UPI002CFBB135|nr:hypothetical protein [Paracoccus sp. (in: a-proteobacteria)]HWL58926.1 hypothetical protein [Paracoccus sp. (in: a-proteobacteria)]
MTAPRPSVTSLEIMPAYGQSENRPLPDALSADLDAATSELAYYTYGMVDENGAMIGPLGAGLAEIDRKKPATGFMAATGHGRISPAFAFQYARAAQWREDGATGRGVVIGDNGFGGRVIREWLPEDASPIGRNQLLWMRENARLADEFQISMACPYVFLFQGTSAKDQPGAAYRQEFEAAHAATLAEARALFGVEPRLVVVVNGADVNSIGDVYETPAAQYRIALDHGGIIATWQRIFPIADRNIHPSGQSQVLIGETCDWAAREVEAGHPWNITYAVRKSGAVVTVQFNLRPGEVLIERPDLYDAFGGKATCPDFGFEAEGGILEATPDFAGGSVRLTLANSRASWLRFAHQSQDCYAMTDGVGVSMSAHRSTLFGSHSRPSRFVAGETLWRPLPGFRGRFEGEGFLPDQG